jgi:hypothetical protein
MLSRSILVLATAIAIGATAADSGSTFGWGSNSSHDRAHGSGFGSGDYMNGGHRRGGPCDGLVGGTFAWPYCDYCTRHSSDRNC